MDSAILLQDSPGEKTDTSIVGAVKNFVGAGRKSSSVVVVRGELLVPIPGDEITPRNDGLKPHNYRLKREPTVSLYCKDDGDDIAPLGAYEELLLEGIKSTTARYEVFISANMLDWGSNLKVGDAVYVGLPSQHPVPVQYAAAVIRFVGGLKGETGIQFGVEITERQFHGCGATTGFFQGDQIFLCEENCGLFVGLDKLSPDRQGSRVKVSSSSQGVKNESSRRKSPILNQRQSDGGHQYGMVTRFRERASNAVQRQHSGSSVDPPRCVFSTGDKVVVYNKKHVRIPGVVRWIGKVTGHGADFTAVGIETDCHVKKEDLADALPNMSHYFKVQNPRHGKVFLPEAFVAPEEVDTQQRAQEQRSSMHKEDRSGTHREGEALAKEFGIPAHEIAEQRQALNYAEHIKEKRDLERLKCQEKQEVEQVQKAVNEHINVDEQRRRLEEIKQERLNIPQQDTHQNAYSSRRGPGLPHQHSQPPMHPTQTGSRLGPPHQFSLDAPHPSPVRQASHEYETLPGMQMQRQATSAEEHLYDHIDTHGPQPTYLHPASSHQSAPPQPNPQQLDPPHFDHFSSGPQGTQGTVAYAPQPQQGVQLGELDVGSTVQISDPPRYGVIKWIGELPNIQGYVAGVELDEYMDGCTDGTWHERRYFTCPYGRGFFCPYYNLLPDRRFDAGGNTSGAASAENPLIGYPLNEQADQTIEYNQMGKYLGDERGIQGHQNSCYLDATVFGLFALSDVFDSMFLGEARDEAGKEIKSILWKGIVNPLRKNGVVRYESVMMLRNKLEELGKMKGVNQDEKDPEEFLNLLFKHILNVEPFVHIKRPFGEEPEYFVQLFVDYDESLKLPTVGDLMKKMFREQDITFTQAPSKLLIQVPRFGKQYKTYEKIIPAAKLNVADLIVSPHECFICEKSAWKQCSACAHEYRSEKRTADGLVYFCDSCSHVVHSPKSRSNHVVQSVVPPPEVADLSELDLLSVICIETSHYVCFVHWEKRWIFFDSMANRVYDMYNIPKGVDCTHDLNEWVYSGDGHKRLLNTPPRELPEYVRRFTQDIYMCVYVNHDVGMYL